MFKKYVIFLPFLLMSCTTTHFQGKTLGNSGLESSTTVGLGFVNGLSVERTYAIDQDTDFSVHAATGMYAVVPSLGAGAARQLFIGDLIAVSVGGRASLVPFSLSPGGGVGPVLNPELNLPITFNHESPYTFTVTPRLGGIIDENPSVYQGVSFGVKIDRVGIQASSFGGGPDIMISYTF